MRYDDAAAQIKKRNPMTQTTLVTRAKGSGIPLRFDINPTDLMEIKRSAGASRSLNDQSGVLYLAYTKRTDGSTWQAEIPLDQVLDIEVRDMRIQVPAGVRQ